MRSYLTQISFSGVLGTPVQTDNVFFFPANPAIVFDYTCVINPLFWEWRPSWWWLEDLVTEYWYTGPTAPGQNPVNFSLSYIPHGLNNQPTINNVPFGVSTPPNYFPLPPATAPYWRDGTEA